MLYLMKRYLPEVSNRGDCRQELSIAALDISPTELKANLDACLLTPDELSAQETWANMVHRFNW